MENPTFTMSQELIDEINSQLEYGDNRSAWVRDAIRLKLDVMELVEEHEVSMTDKERREFVRKTVEKALENQESESSL